MLRQVESSAQPDAAHASSNAGGDFGVASGSLTLSSGGGSFTVLSQAGMISDVQSWLDNPSGNFGWLMKYQDESTTGTARGFVSREGDIQSVPQLTIDYTVIPEPRAGLLLLAAALVPVSFRARRA